jgi:glucose dehydrogenase
LVFISGTLDGMLRAFDINTGKIVWQTALPAGGQATPMTYELNGKQYVVIAGWRPREIRAPGSVIILSRLHWNNSSWIVTRSGR